MAEGPTFTVTEIGRRKSGEEEIRVVAYLPTEGKGEQAFMDRLSLTRVFMEMARGLLAKWSGDELFAREVTGYDEVGDNGLPASAPLRIKGAMRPLHVTEVTDWEPFYPPRA